MKPDNQGSRRSLYNAASECIRQICGFELGFSPKQPIFSGNLEFRDQLVEQPESLPPVAALYDALSIG
jgi:hypothetical protein